MNKNDKKSKFKLTPPSTIIKFSTKLGTDQLKETTAIHFNTYRISTTLSESSREASSASPKNSLTRTNTPISSTLRIFWPQAGNSRKKTVINVKNTKKSTNNCGQKYQVFKHKFPPYI